jgi:hypothetical protein
LPDNIRGIGTTSGWERRLQGYGVEIQGHSLIQKPINFIAVNLVPKIERHKEAIIRHDLSHSVRLALDVGLFSPETTFLIMVVDMVVM